MPDSKTVGGWYKQSGVFTFMAIPKAGHFIPTTQL